MQGLVVRKKTTNIVLFSDTETIVSKNIIPKIVVAQETKTLISKNSIPTIVVNNDLIMAPEYPYIDGGLYNQDGDYIDAGFYNTTVWDFSISGGYV